MAKRKTTPYNRSLERALQILSAFSFEHKELTLGELSSLLNLPKPTVYRLAYTLIKHDFLRYSSELKKYSLGLRLFELGSIVFSTFSLRKAASPHLDRLESTLGKTVMLGIFQEGEVMYIDKRESLSGSIRFSSEIGRRRPPYFGMLGQVLMASFSDEEVDKILTKNPLKPITKKSITSRKKFKERLHKIRKQGFFVDKEEGIEGITGIAAPVRDYAGKVIAALGVAFISSSEDDQGRDRIIQEVRKTAKIISQDLGNIQGDTERGNAYARSLAGST